MKNVGIWIDTRQAIIVTLDGRKITTQTIYSGTSRKLKVEGEGSKKSVRGGIGFDFKTSQENRHREELRKFFMAVIEEMKESDKLYLLGPSSAKLLLEKDLRKAGIKGNRIARVETCDTLTINQLIAKVREFFTPVGKIKSLKVKKSKKRKS